MLAQIARFVVVLAGLLANEGQSYYFCVLSVYRQNHLAISGPSSVPSRLFLMPCPAKRRERSAYFSVPDHSGFLPHELLSYFPTKNPSCTESPTDDFV